jgi:hypothetical protein
MNPSYFNGYASTTAARGGRGRRGKNRAPDDTAAS